MSRPRPVIGPDPRTGEPTTWPSGKDAAAAWGRTRACICHWLATGRIGWSYADGLGRKRKTKLGAKPCAVCGLTFRQRPDERDDAFRARKTGSDDCRLELVAAAKRGRTWSTESDRGGGLPVSSLNQPPPTPDQGKYWT